MSVKSLAGLLCSLLLLAPACSDADANRQANAPTNQQSARPTVEANAAAPVGFDACALLTSSEIESVQGEAVKESKGSEEPAGPVRVAQCFYVLPTFTKSVSLAVGYAPGEGGRGVREFWREKFGGEEEERREEREHGERHEEKGRKEREGEEAEEKTPPQRVAGVGEAAFWAGDARAGSLYVLKGEKFIRVSVGGAEDAQQKIKRMKSLAQLALKRL